MSTKDNTRLAEWLADHPRMLGALFVTVTLLTQAGAAVANTGNATAGP